MNKTLLVSLAILTASTSGVLAAQQTRHARAMNSNAAMGAPPATMMGNRDQDMYMKNLRDSGYDPKNDFSKSGHMREK